MQINFLQTVISTKIQTRIERNPEEAKQRVAIEKQQPAK